MDKPQVYTIAEVIQGEQDFLEAQRVSAAADNVKTTDQERLSICFSGGGIRSAAFNLGVLQYLAETKQLSKIDYLSTVSGGGYIGSWFMALLKRSGDLEEVERLLTPKIQRHATEKPSTVQADVNSPFDHVGDPYAIRHLRTHSNYLAPRVGIFSTDLWALWAIYLRNTFLNTLVLAPLMLAIIFLLRYLRFFQTSLSSSPTVPTIQLSLGACCALLAFVHIALSLRRCRSVAENNFKDPTLARLMDTLWLPVLVFFVATTLIGAGIRYNKEIGPQQVQSNYFHPEVFSDYGPWVFFIGGLIQVSLFNHGSFRALAKLVFRRGSGSASRNQPLRWIFSGFLSGGVTSLALYSLAVFFPVLEDQRNQKHFDKISHPETEINNRTEEQKPDQTESDAESVCKFTDNVDDFQDDWKISLAAYSLIPLVLTIFSLSQSLQVGILGSLEKREVREKWSFLHAYCAVAGLGWMAAFTLGVVIPDWIYGLIMHQKYYVATSLGALGGSISGIAIWLAQSLWTGKKTKPALDFIVKIGPYVALAIGLIAVGLIAKWLTLEAFGGWSDVFAGHGVLYLFLACLGASTIAARYVDVNIFSLQEMYENRLVRAFLGASQADRKCTDPVTYINPKDDIPLMDIGVDIDGNAHGPIHLINTAMNLSGSDQREYDERKADSFILSPLYCGSPMTGYRKTSDGYAGQLTLGRAFSTSGAAVSPNMGYYSTAAVTALLTFCNLRLGGWFPNPKSIVFTEPSPKFGWLQIIQEILGRTDAQQDYIYLSDGGHFDNLGAYELVRRRCKNIYICDAGADPKGACHELALLIRKCRIDFGTEIQIDVSQLKRNQQTGFSESQFADGCIFYPATENQAPTIGKVFYLKLNLTQKDPTDLLSYQIRNPDFPHQSTLDQFYSESQFESYRHLGYVIACKAFSAPNKP